MLVKLACGSIQTTTSLLLIQCRWRHSSDYTIPYRSCLCNGGSIACNPTSFPGHTFDTLIPEVKFEQSTHKGPNWVVSFLAPWKSSLRSYSRGYVCWVLSIKQYFHFILCESSTSYSIIMHLWGHPGLSKVASLVGRKVRFCSLLRVKDRN